MSLRPVPRRSTLPDGATWGAVLRDGTGQPVHTYHGERFSLYFGGVLGCACGCRTVYVECVANGVDCSSGITFPRGAFMQPATVVFEALHRAVAGALNVSGDGLTVCAFDLARDLFAQLPDPIHPPHRDGLEHESGCPLSGVEPLPPVCVCE